MTKLWRLGLILLLILTIMGHSLPTSAQESIQVTGNEHEYAFRDHITFRLEASSETEITEIKLSVRIGGESGRQRDEPEFEPAKSVSAEIVWDKMEEDTYRPPGVQIKYWWDIKDAAGNKFKTETIAFTYMDDKHNWRVLDNENLALYWYEGDGNLGSTLFERAVAAMDQIEAELGVEIEDKVKIFIYGTYDDLRASLGEGSSEWVGGISFSDYAIVAAGVAPSNIDYGLRVIPHELTHAVIAQMMEPPFGKLPHWMDEGLAMHYEGPMTFSETAALQKAIETDSLLSIRSLASNFPEERALVDLSYAESNSVVEYIFEVYGNGTMARLLEVFGLGAHQDDGFLEVLGIDVDGLEDEWRAYIGAPARHGETRATPVSSSTPIPRPTLVMTDTPMPAATPQSETALTETPIPPPTASPTPPEEARAGLWCLSALPGAALLGLFLVFGPRTNR